MLGRRKQSAPEATGPTRVLVVNEDEHPAELLRRILTEGGYEVSTAASHEEALTALNAAKPQCVVLDLATGGIGQNLKLLDVIRSHLDDEVAASRVVLVAHQTSNRMFSWEAGIDAYLVRPFHAEELLHDVAEVLARPEDERERHRHRQLRASSGEGRTVEARPWVTRRF